jgi:hypothetical protein
MMQLNKSIIASLSLATFAFATTSANAAVLAVDLQDGSNTATGFEGQGLSGGPYTTALGNMTVTVTDAQGVFDRGTPSGANQIDDFYRDFIFDNNSDGFTITITGAGIIASTAYEMTFYAYDSGEVRPTAVAGSAGTTGTKLTGFAATATTGPTSLDQHAGTSVFTSDATGTLTFFVDGSSSGGTGRSSINGFELNAVPEPTTTALLGLGGLALIMRRRK